MVRLFSEGLAVGWGLHFYEFFDQIIEAVVGWVEFAGSRRVTGRKLIC